MSKEFKLELAAGELQVIHRALMHLGTNMLLDLERGKIQPHRIAGVLEASTFVSNLYNKIDDYLKEIGEDPDMEKAEERVAKLGKEILESYNERSNGK